MPVPRPISIQSTDDGFDRVAESQNKAINHLLDNPLNSPLVLQNVSLTSGVNKIPHGLGRKYLGWFLANPQGGATVYTSPGNTSPDKTLWLNSSANVVTDIVVY